MKAESDRGEDQRGADVGEGPTVICRAVAGMTRFKKCISPPRELRLVT